MFCLVTDGVAIHGFAKRFVQGSVVKIEEWRDTEMGICQKADTAPFMSKYIFFRET
jgi:hypothetical protein